MEGQQHYPHTLDDSGSRSRSRSRYSPPLSGSGQRRSLSPQQQQQPLHPRDGGAHVDRDRSIRPSSPSARDAAHPPSHLSHDRSPSPYHSDPPHPRDSRPGSPPSARTEGENQVVNQGNNLFVSGIAASISESDLSDTFSEFGTIESIQILKDPHATAHRGFGFISFRTAEEATTALNSLHGHTLQGRALSIAYAKRSRPRTPTPGRYAGISRINGPFGHPSSSSSSSSSSSGHHHHHRRGREVDSYRSTFHPRHSYDREDRAYSDRASHPERYRERPAYRGAGRDRDYEPRGRLRSREPYRSRDRYVTS
ncbi:MAG: hypothetical protein DHS80DRAFT_16796 [Piptocephalis tieghemiana]|nr:MAG: hypothetical protein DHS80DRAFT_16796 [Piptocephalis tieghemiana]